MTKWERYAILRVVAIRNEGSVDRISRPADTTEPLGPVGKFLVRYQELYNAGKLQFSTPEERRAELEEAIRNAEAFKKTWTPELHRK